jgi:hypothetical protein
MCAIERIMFGAPYGTASDETLQTIRDAWLADMVQTLDDDLRLEYAASFEAATPVTAH